MEPARGLGSAVERRERRFARRYPIGARLSYKVLRGSEVIQSGHGRTLDISSTGVLFEPVIPVAAGAGIELSIEWPAPLSSSTGLHLSVKGSTIRTTERGTAVRLQAYELRTRADAVEAKPTKPALAGKAASAKRAPLEHALRENLRQAECACRNAAVELQAVEERYCDLEPGHTEDALARKRAAAAKAAAATKYQQALKAFVDLVARGIPPARPPEGEGT